MVKNRFRTRGLRAGTLLSLLCCTCFTASGCGSENPTEPEPTTLPELFSNQLYRADGSAVGIQSLEDTPLIGLYFASPGCPACGAFTPLLVNAYHQWEEEGRSFEVVLVVLGISDADLFDYMTESNMPWLAVSSQSGQANSLAQRYDIRWVPTLVIIDDATNLISRNGREELTQRGSAAYDDWLAERAGG